MSNKAKILILGSVAAMIGDMVSNKEYQSEQTGHMRLLVTGSDYQMSCFEITTTIEKRSNTFVSSREK